MPINLSQHLHGPAMQFGLPAASPSIANKGEFNGAIAVGEAIGRDAALRCLEDGYHMDVSYEYERGRS
ncbi:hypothetical protein EW146_g8963 [Bondarzewia mesenterica]|uniref:Uncharacterized protein n=1 Tax=Bondarzewia mesenterica TaxID=1095465 RepID=A0A4V3XD63_9AGAM|nr:hypothetical protein EW146_g8963 [Bondarzewia mesenterica]